MTTVARRVADEMGCPLGQAVGYSIRFEDVTSETTRIKFLTDGLLLREALVDPLLSRYAVIMVDEAHERSLGSDVLLGVLKKVSKRRSDLRIIVSSATLHAQRFLDFFGGAAVLGNEDHKSPNTCIVSIEGRAHPVDIHYLAQPCEQYLERAASLVFDIHSSEPDGDVLIFLTGRDEIEKVIEIIADRLPSLPAGSQSILPLPLYAGLSTEQQMYVFEPAPENTRKVICATNIAEASVTIDGIVYVIDCGFVKLRAYNPTTGIETLATTPVSRASATQRAGRAGRTKPGKCYRLYTEDDFHSLEEATVPEIQRSNLAPMILQLKALGIDNIARFDFLTPPPAELIIRALELLFSLGALDDYAKLTHPLGTRMAELALEPMLAKCLLSAPAFGCLSEMLTIAAMVSLQGNIWFSTHGDDDDDDRKKSSSEKTARRKFAVEEGDHLTLLNVYHAFITTGKKEPRWCQQHHLNFQSMIRAVSIRNQLRRYLERLGIDVSESLSSSSGNGNHHGSSTSTTKESPSSSSSSSIMRCLTSGYFAHAARMAPDGTFRTISSSNSSSSSSKSGGGEGGRGGVVLHAHPSSLMFHRKADFVIFSEVMETGEKIFIRDVSKIEKGWLLEYAPEYYRVKEVKKG